MACPQHWCRSGRESRCAIPSTSRRANTQCSEGRAWQGAGWWRTGRFQAVEAIVLARGRRAACEAAPPTSRASPTASRAMALRATLDLRASGDLSGQRYGQVIRACPPRRAAPQHRSTPRPRSIALTGCDQAGLPSEHRAGRASPGRRGSAATTRDMIQTRGISGRANECGRWRWRWR